MPELAIADNDFAPLLAAKSVPRRLEFENCDLSKTAPPRELAGLKSLEVIDCTLDGAVLKRWLSACPDLEELGITGTQLGPLTWDMLPKRLQQLQIHGGELTSLLDAPTTCGLQVISLTACKLQTVELPKSLSNLRNIDLSWNQALGKCPDLPWAAKPFKLALRECGLTAWPDVDGIDKVSVLELSNNAIETVPAAIKSCHSLDTLRMQACQLTTIDPEVATLPFLANVWLKDNPLGELPTGLCELANLKVLEVVRCQLQEWPEALHNVSTLETLLMSENRIKQVPDSLVSMSKLRSLHLWKTELQQLPASLRGLDELKQLDISYNPLTVLPELAGLPSLAYLAVCGLRDLDWQQGFDRLAELQRISTISFTNCEFERFDLRVLQIPELTRIDVNKTPVAESEWQQLRAAHPNVIIWT
ncbi:MAG: Leucine-rich repeat (LRR) protein [Planctomycetota bacterium]|jgi:Leucine-rich repeat (LRR) protein